MSLSPTHWIAILTLVAAVAVRRFGPDMVASRMPRHAQQQMTGPLVLSDALVVASAGLVIGWRLTSVLTVFAMAQALRLLDHARTHGASGSGMLGEQELRNAVGRGRLKGLPGKLAQRACGGTDRPWETDPGWPARMRRLSGWLLTMVSLLWVVADTAIALLAYLATSVLLGP